MDVGKLITSALTSSSTDASACYTEILVGRVVSTGQAGGALGGLRETLGT